jgi:L-alanine-DL-glutamate epimerase-like enolase superfamily enzyme
MLARVLQAPEAAVEALTVAAYRVPTDAPESDGTLEWDATTLVVVEVRGGGERGLGYTYADVATARLVAEHLAGVVAGRAACALPAAWLAMVRAVRNLGRPGLASMAISAVDAALWDLEARILGLPLVTLLGSARPAVPVYGSGGFTSYPVGRLQDQLAGWAEQGLRGVKMKVGREPEKDVARVRAARAAIGPEVELMVDANGAYGRKQALRMGHVCAELGVTWFEEPVSSDDLAGLRLHRDRMPPGIEVAAGEYGYDLPYFRRMLAAGAVDVLQADASRCAGVTGFVKAAALSEAAGLDLSAHCAPALHLHAACALLPLRHIEWFHDHARIEHMLFDGAPHVDAGALRPDLTRPGCGLELRSADAERFRIA